MARDRVQVRVDPQTGEEIVALQKWLGIKRLSAILDVALGILSWAVATKLSGMEVAKYDPKDGTLYLLSHPQLDKVGRERLVESKRKQPAPRRASSQR